MKYLLIIMLFASCMTQKKAEGWMNAHENEAAHYCSAKFPVVPHTDTVYQAPDTSKYVEAKRNLEHTLNSVLAELQRKTNTATPEHPYRPNIDSIRIVLAKDIRRGLEPCKDSTKFIKYTVVDRAREIYLQGILDARNKTIGDKDKLISTCQEKYAGAIKYVWMFWALVAAIVVYAILRFRFKLLP